MRELEADDDTNFGFGDFAKKLRSGGAWGGPRKGNKDDKAHPPIHPVKLPNKSELDTPAEQKIYEILTRHFLASLAKDATGEATTVTLTMADETFKAGGLHISQHNFIEVYPHDPWSEKTLPHFKEGSEIKPSLKVDEGNTSPPAALTEADLITQMDNHGIGTDATIHEHIKNI